MEADNCPQEEKQAEGEDPRLFIRCVSLQRPKNAAKWGNQFVQVT